MTHQLSLTATITGSDLDAIRDDLDSPTAVTILDNVATIAQWSASSVWAGIRAERALVAIQQAPEGVSAYDLRQIAHDALCEFECSCP